MPWGSTSAEARHIAGKNPRGRAHGGGGIILGMLDEMVVEKGKSVRRYGKSHFRGAYLAWLPGKKNFAVVFKRKGERKSSVLSPSIQQLHRTFHNVPPRAAGTFEWPDKKGATKQLGLIRSLTYSIPPDLKSPEKNGYNWVHAFGDHGESGHGPLTRTKTYPDSLKPMAVIDSAGNLFIVRRPSNKYHVTKWIYW
jgi:hypothetical protein